MEKFQTKKKFGQNFLTDKNLLSAICEDAEISSEDEVLEIGAGMGALTEQLSQRAKKVISFEIDSDLQDFLLAKNLENTKFVFEDVMKKDLKEIENMFEGPFKIVANLPYYITTPILFKFFESDKVKSLTVMVQKEVAERMVAKEGGKDYGVLSVSIKALGGAKITRNVSRHMFSPAPNVDSAVVRIDIKKQKTHDMQQFFDFVKMIFSMRRKTLLNNLLAGAKFSREELEKMFGEELLKRRAETFSVEEVVFLFETFSKKQKQI